MYLNIFNMSLIELWVKGRSNPEENTKLCVQEGMSNQKTICKWKLM